MFKKYIRESLVVTLLHLFSWLSLRMCHRVGTMVGWCMVLFPNEMKRVAERNLALCFPDKTAIERRILLKHTLLESAKGVSEMGAVWLWPTQKLMQLTRQVTGQHLIDEALHESNNGLVLVIPHLGSWEFLGCYLGYHYGITGMAKPLRMAGLNQLVSRARVRHGGTLVATDVAGIRELYRRLARGKMIAILPDQEPSLGQGIFAKFFGVQAKSAILIPRLIQKSQASIVYGFAERLPNGAGFDVHFLPGSLADSVLDKEASLAQITTVLNQGVEWCIKCKPEQYIWSYKRFRSRPPGEPIIY